MLPRIRVANPTKEANQRIKETAAEKEEIKAKQENQGRVRIKKGVANPRRTKAAKEKHISKEEKTLDAWSKGWPTQGAQIR